MPITMSPLFVHLVTDLKGVSSIGA